MIVGTIIEPIFPRTFGGHSHSSSAESLPVKSQIIIRKRLLIRARDRSFVRQLFIRVGFAAVRPFGFEVPEGI